MSVLQRIFGNTSPPNAPNPQQNNPIPGVNVPNDPTTIATATDPRQLGNTSPTNNPTVPSANTQQSDGSVVAIPKTSTGSASPLDGYKDLWQIDAGKSTEKPSLVPNINFDQAGLLAAAQKVDFSTQISQELMDKAVKGDAVALRAAINSAAQVGLAQSATIAAAVVKDALEKQSKVLQEHYVPDILNRERVNTALASDRQRLNLDNPAIAPVVDMLTQQVRAKYPTADANEVKTHVITLMQGFGEEVIRGSGRQIIDAPKPQKSNGRNIDWEAWFNSGAGIVPYTQQ